MHSVYPTGVHGALPQLPIIETVAITAVRPKRRYARRRAIALAAVHVFILVHIAHFLLNRRTLSPIEPSEAMYTLELGYVNAGAVLFTLAVASTAVFGRFFCGWG